MTKKKSEKAKEKGLLQDILKDDRDKKIAELLKENELLQDKAGYWMDQNSIHERDAAHYQGLYLKAEETRNSELASLQRSHQEDLQACAGQLKKRDAEIGDLHARLKNYAGWVQRILQYDFQIQPPEVALGKIAFVLEILRASLAGETLEGAMQRLGYLETVFGFEREPVKPAARKFVLQIRKTEKLYRYEASVDPPREPSSTQIYGIKELRQHLGLGLKDAKDITDTLHTGGMHLVSGYSQEDAYAVAAALARSGYFTVTVVEE